MKRDFSKCVFPRVGSISMEIWREKGEKGFNLCRPREGIKFKRSTIRDQLLD